MPRYDFRCLETGTIFEHVMGFDDDRSLVKCPECKSDTERVISDVGVAWNCSGGTRGFGGGGKIPKTPGINAGHEPPTLGKLGLTEAQGRELGIT